MVNNLNRFYSSREEVINFCRDYIEMLSNANYDGKQNKNKGPGLKILTPKQMLQRLPTALPRVKAANNSESLLNEKFKSKMFILCISQNESLKKYTT